MKLKIILKSLLVSYIISFMVSVSVYYFWRISGLKYSPFSVFSDNFFNSFFVMIFSYPVVYRLFNKDLSNLHFIKDIDIFSFPTRLTYLILIFVVIAAILSPFVLLWFWVVSYEISPYFIFGFIYLFGFYLFFYFRQKAKN